MFRWILAAIAVPALSVAIWLAYAGLVINAREAPPVFAGAPGVHRGDYHNYESVPLVRLLVTPERYDGRRVRVEGYLTLHFEGTAVHLDRTAYEAGLSKNAIWLDRPQWLTHSDERRLTRNYAEIAGVFRASEHGHLGDFSGALTEVRGIGRSLTQQDYERMRLRWSRNALLGTALSPWLLTLVGWTALATFWLMRRLAK